MYNCFGFQGCGSIEPVVAPSIFHFFLGMKVLANIELRKVTCPYDMLSLSNIMKFQHVTCSSNLEVL